MRNVVQLCGNVLHYVTMYAYALNCLILCDNFRIYVHIFDFVFLISTYSSRVNVYMPFPKFKFLGCEILVLGTKFLVFCCSEEILYFWDLGENLKNTKFRHYVENTKFLSFQKKPNFVTTSKTQNFVITKKFKNPTEKFKIPF